MDVICIKMHANGAQFSSISFKDEYSSGALSFFLPLFLTLRLMSIIIIWIAWNMRTKPSVSHNPS